jgi:hypothetical protein
MPARRTRPVAHAVVTAMSASALALALATPGVARPAGPAPAEAARAAVHATVGTPGQPPDASTQAQTGSLAGTTDATPVNAPGTDVAAPDQQNPLPAPGTEPVAVPVLERPRVVSIDRGTETLVVVAIAAAALLAGTGAGFAGGRRLAVRAG